MHDDGGDERGGELRAVYFHRRDAMHDVPQRCDREG